MSQSRFEKKYNLWLHQNSSRFSIFYLENSFSKKT